MVEMVGSFALDLDCKMARLVLGLERYQVERDLHFVTFRCFHRLGYLKTAGSRDLFEEALARMGYRFSLK
jgi:hypothetical protein